MQYITTKTLFRIRVLLLTGTVAILAIVFLDIFLNHSQTPGSLGRKKSKSSSGQHDDLKVADELLHARLWQLQDMDQQFASLLTRQYDQNSLARTNSSIQSAEESFRKSIDSIAQVGTAYDQSSGTNDFENMSTFFRKILENRRFIAFTRMGIVSGNEGSGNDKQTILKLQNEIYEKDKMIAAAATDKAVMALQTQLGEKDKRIFALETQIQKEQAEKQGFTETAQRLQGQLAEKDKVIASFENKKTSPDQKIILNLQTDLNAKNKQIADLQRLSQTEKQTYTQTLQKLQSDLTEKNTQLAAATKKLPNDQKALAGLQNEVGVKNKQITDLQRQAQTDKQTYTQSLQRLQTELGEKNKELAAATKKLPTDQKALAGLQTEISTRNKQISDLRTQLQQEQSDKKANDQKFQSDLAQKNKMIDALSNIKIPTDDKALASLQKDIAAKNKQINDLEGQVTELSRTVSTASASKAPVTDQKNLVALQNEVSTKNKQISTLQAQVKKEETEKLGYSKTIQELQLQLIEKNKLIASAGNRKVPADQKAIVTLQNEIAEKDRRIKRLEDQLLVTNASNRQPVEAESAKELEQRNTNLRLAYNNTMSQLGVLQKKYNSLKAEMDQIRGQ